MGGSSPSQQSIQSDIKTNSVNEIEESKFNNRNEKNAEIKTESEIYSKLITAGKVETFDWKYEEKLWNPETKKFEMTTINLNGIEAIYINPKWKKSKVGDFLTFNQDKKKKGKKHRNKS